MSILKHISLIVFLFIGSIAMSQKYTSVSFEFYKEKSYDSALVYINKAIETDEKNNSQTWQLRGFLYKVLELESNTTLRELSINSFIQAYKANATHKDSIEIKKHLTHVNIRYYNDAVNQISSHELELSVESYKIYKNNCEVFGLEHKDFNEMDVPYYNAIAGSYIEFNKSKIAIEKIGYYTKAIRYYNKILVIDSLNYKANYGIGLSYYNQAVDLIMAMDPFETNIEDINDIQNRSIFLFKKGEPFFLKAYSLKPKELEVLEGLAGIYNSMNENEKFKFYEELLEEVKGNGNE